MSKIMYGKPGSFCWAELLTADEKKAKEFYQKIFGWQYSEVPMPHENTHYTFASLKEGSIAGIFEITKEMHDKGVPPHWASYVSCTNLDETVERAVKLGAKVYIPPMDVMESGRLAVLQDPTNAALSLWQSNKEGPEIPRNLHGMIGWNELLTTDANKAESFYVNLFGWDTTKEQVQGKTYVSFTKDGKYVAGMMQIQKEMGPIPSNWAIYFTVDDINTSLEIAKKAGGMELYPIMSLENIGKMTAIKDPSGAVFSIFEWVKNT